MNRTDAQALDRKDPLAKKRKLFSLPRGKIYLDGNSLGVLPKGAALRVKHAIEVEWGRDLITSWNKHGWWNLAQRIGGKIAKLIGAPADCVIVADTISINMFKVLSAAIKLRPGRKVVLSDTGNFPSDLYVAQGMVRFLENDLRLKLVDPQSVFESLSDEVAVVMLTDTDYRSARRHDMMEITAKAHAVGALVIWDLAHSAGAVPVDLMGCNADFAVGCTYKYLNGGPGAPAFLFVHPRLQNEAVPALVGWWGHAKPFDFSTEFEPAVGVKRFQSGTQAILNMVALDAAMDAWKGVSMNRLYAKAIEQCEMFAELAERRCEKFGISFYGDRDFSRRGSHVCLQHTHAYAVMQALISRGVVGDFRAPNLMRFGFTPLYTSYVDVFDSVEHLHKVLAKELWRKKKFMAKKSVT